MKSGCEVCEIVIDPPSFAAPPLLLLPPPLSSLPPQAITTDIERAARRSASARLPSFPILYSLQRLILRAGAHRAGWCPPGGNIPVRSADLTIPARDKICP